MKVIQLDMCIVFLRKTSAGRRPSRFPQSIQVVGARTSLIYQNTA